MSKTYTRAEFLKLMAGTTAGAALMASGARLSFAGSTGPMLKRAIPKSGELLPVVGLGTAQDFGVADDAEVYASRVQVIRALLEGEGTLIDTSPTYTEAETVVGKVLEDLSLGSNAFIATKISISGEQDGVDQAEQSFVDLRTDVIDLLQVHNLRDTDKHLKTIRRLKEEGRVRYIGITHSRVSQNNALAHVMETEEIDFVQVQYSLGERSAEERVLPVAAERGIAVLTNLPYARGRLFGAVSGLALPEWAAEFDADTWGQFFLKFLIANPAVTAVIPGTNKAHHMVDNLGAGRGRLPTTAHRKKMVDFFEGL